MNYSLYNTFFSNGKLLLTGEYIILYGANSIALSTRQGQSLTVCYEKNMHSKSYLYWSSITNNNKYWFKGIFSIPKMDIFYDNNNRQIANNLKNCILKFKSIQKHFLQQSFITIYVTTKLEFPINWGLGSSSTLISNIAKWADINDILILLKHNKIQGIGSGYDIACSFYQESIIFKLQNNNIPMITPIKFNPSFKKQLFFLYLNKKKNTVAGIKLFINKNKTISKLIIDLISSITNKILFCKTLKEFEKLLFQHEKIISDTLGLPTVKEKLFPDYLGLVKSLGTWGGDFVLISFRSGMKKYFYKKGFNTIISFEKMIL
ncbi:GYDIA family GHMP kinase [Blattabacterium cuenoti]|uniref:GYDIA family GHMP kinase n=1 Tax=Blattabacterium cuenoti TaxID=1653831 RepID=UPI00163D37D9|nr:GYDIA family GHMP kinase [Blattabacterium cuenoti]